jgi:hypothetical protein
VIAAVARCPRHFLGRQAVRLRAHLRRGRLNAALAAGADPWGSADLMLRASQLSSLPRRQEVAAALEQLVIFAEHNRAVLPSSQQRLFCPCLRIRCGVVLEQRDALLELAARLREPAPLSVAIVATLAWLAKHESSPVYVGGNPPVVLADTAAHCRLTLGRTGERL